MKLSYFFLPLVTAAAACVQAAGAAEIIPGLASYEVPAFFRQITTPQRFTFPVVEYLATDNNSVRFRQMNVRIRPVGRMALLGQLTYLPAGDDELKKALLDDASPRATNYPKVEETVFAGHQAFQLHCSVPMPDLSPGTVILFETLWIRTAPNRVLEIKMAASNADLLATVRSSLAGFKISLPEVAGEVIGEEGRRPVPYQPGASPQGSAGVRIEG